MLCGGVTDTGACFKLIHVAGNLLEGPQVWFDMYCGAKLLDGAKLLWCARGPSGQRLFAAFVGAKFFDTVRSTVVGVT